MSGLGWMGLSGGGRALLHVLHLAILARLLSPAEFGVAAASLVVVAFTQVFSEAGIGSAVIQRTEVTERHIRAGLTFQVLVSFALWGGLWLSADAIAALFRMPTLAAVIPVMTSLLVIRSLTLGGFLLLRALEFRRAAAIEFGSWLVGNAALAVALAVRGWGVWAIVAGNVGQAFLRTVTLLIVKPHPVRPLWDTKALRQLLSFGSGYTLAWWANFFAREGDNFVVGRWLGAEALGLYTRAYGLMRQPATIFGTVAGQVLFPAMAAVKNDVRRLRRTYLDGICLLALAVMPVSGFAAATSAELISVLLGERWLDLKPAFDVMVVGMLFRTSYKLSDSLASATGRVFARAWRQVLYAALVVIGALVGSGVGTITAVSVGTVIALTVNYLAMGQLSLSIIDARWPSFARAHLPGALLTAVTVVPTWVLVRVLRSVQVGALPVLAVAALTFLVLVIAAIRLAPNASGSRRLVRPLRDALRQVRPDSRQGRAARRLLGPAYDELSWPAAAEVAP